MMQGSIFTRGFWPKGRLYMKDQYKELKEDVLDEETAMGTYLMNFYNGVENMIKRISKEYYLTMPKGENWHKELLLLSVNPPQGKIPLFSQSIVEKLNTYRNFRHRFVSGYGFQLKAEKMLELADNITPLWSEVKTAISDFWKKVNV